MKILAKPKYNLEAWTLVLKYLSELENVEDIEQISFEDEREKQLVIKELEKFQ